MTSSRRDIRHGFGFLASLAFFPKRKEYRSAKTSWNMSRTHSLAFNEICNGPIRGTTFFRAIGIEGELE
jgi:hypothetical protein